MGDDVKQDVKNDVITTLIKDAKNNDDKSDVIKDAK